MTTEGGDRPKFTSIQGGKLSTGELSGTRSGELAGRQAVAFLNRFNSFREAHPINTDLTPASQTYHHLVAFRNILTIEGDKEGSEYANEITRGLFVHAFIQFSEADKVTVTQDYGIGLEFFERSLQKHELGVSLDEPEAIILQTLLAELDIPFTPKPPYEMELYFTRFIWEMRKVAVAHNLLLAEPESAEGELTISDTPPPNVLSMEGRTTRRSR